MMVIIFCHWRNGLGKRTMIKRLLVDVARSYEEAHQATGVILAILPDLHAHCFRATSSKAPR